MKEIGPIKCPCCWKAMVYDYDICPFCGWENDPIQLSNPDRKGGANRESLNEAKKLYAEHMDMRKAGFK